MRGAAAKTTLASCARAAIGVAFAVAVAAVAVAAVAVAEPESRAAAAGGADTLVVPIGPVPLTFVDRIRGRLTNEDRLARFDVPREKADVAQVKPALRQARDAIDDGQVAQALEVLVQTERRAFELLAPEAAARAAGEIRALIAAAKQKTRQPGASADLGLSVLIDPYGDVEPALQNEQRRLRAIQGRQPQFKLDYVGPPGARFFLDGKPVGVAGAEGRAPAPASAIAGLHVAGLECLDGTVLGKIVDVRGGKGAPPTTVAFDPGEGASSEAATEVRAGRILVALRTESNAKQADARLAALATVTGLRVLGVGPPLPGGPRTGPFRIALAMPKGGPIPSETAADDKLEATLASLGVFAASTGSKKGSPSATGAGEGPGFAVESEGHYRPPPPAPPLSSQWWFWTIVGGAALGAAGAATFVATRPPGQATFRCCGAP